MRLIQETKIEKKAKYLKKKRSLEQLKRILFTPLELMKIRKYYNSYAKRLVPSARRGYSCCKTRYTAGVYCNANTNLPRPPSPFF